MSFNLALMKDDDSVCVAAVRNREIVGSFAL